jgi:hypothetical protein
MYHTGCINPFAGMRQDKNDFYENPVVCIPCRTAQQARKIAKFWNMTEEERVGIATKACYRDVFGESWEYRSHQQEKTATSVARAVLAAITGGRT